MPGFPVRAHCAYCGGMTRQTVVREGRSTMDLVCCECGAESKRPIGSKGIGRVEEVTSGERLGDVVPR